MLRHGDRWRWTNGLSQLQHHSQATVKQVKLMVNESTILRPSWKIARSCSGGAADILMDEMMLGGVDMAIQSPRDYANGGLRNSSGRRSFTPASQSAESGRTTEPDQTQFTTHSAEEDLSAHSAPRSSQDTLLRPPSSAGYREEQDAAEDFSLAESWGHSPRSPRRQVRTNNLLPRMSQMDVRQLQEQLVTLREDAARLLPPDHDWQLRSLHLLEKAELLLRSAPDRTAEVEYYLQQVRAILERARQTHDWSKAYLKRLTIYHGAWLLLSLTVLVGCLLYPWPLTRWVAPLLRQSTDSLAAGFIVPYLAVLGAACLGTSLGALRNMRRHRLLDKGFFDRKYSLRGLLLPVFALLTATVVFGLFVLVCWITGTNPLYEPLYIIVPAVIALLFGFFQESIYGTAPKTPS